MFIFIFIAIIIFTIISSIHLRRALAVFETLWSWSSASSFRISAGVAGFSATATLTLQDQ